jgi:hypothetical protein
MSTLKEYVVTLHNFEDLESFYQDMETSGGDLFIPDRAVTVANRRTISRNTHYMLTAEEAEQLRNDPRVQAVELTPQQLGLKPRPLYTQTSNFWNKSTSASNTHINWGLLRCVEGQQRSNWGSNGTTNQSGTIKVSAEGRNVDVIIVDGHFDPSHPEYAKNADGTGGSRVIQYNWFQHNSVVWPSNPSSTYVYTPYNGGGNSDLEGDNNHGAHVAGTVAGNTQGWARQANIYNISPYGTNPNVFDTLYLVDYIREFHRNKPINPITGRKNPTITNHSWGYGISGSISELASIVWRGSTYFGPFTASQLTNTYGITNNGVDFYAPYVYSPLDADIQDAINEGIIFVGAASNDYMKIDVSGGQDYNNRLFSTLGYAHYYHRGSSPGQAANVICVGAVGILTNDSKASFSNCGPRIDIFAPGSYILSSLNTGGITDARNSSYRIGKLSGTSMASPQVCGVLTCALELYPSMTPSQALSYLLSSSKSNQMTSTSGGYGDYTDLQGAPNKYLALRIERPTSGSVFPKSNYFLRPSSGAVYPRVKAKKYSG